MQIKTTMRQHSHLLGWLSSRKEQVTSAGKDVEKRGHLRTIGGNVNWFKHKGKQHESSSKN